MIKSTKVSKIGNSVIKCPIQQTHKDSSATEIIFSEVLVTGLQMLCFEVAHELFLEQAFISRKNSYSLLVFYSGDFRWLLV